MVELSLKFKDISNEICDKLAIDIKITMTLRETKAAKGAAPLDTSKTKSVEFRNKVFCHKMRKRKIEIVEPLSLQKDFYPIAQH